MAHGAKGCKPGFAPKAYASTTPGTVITAANRDHFVDKAGWIYIMVEDNQSIYF
ncbi:hypothetical protein CERSUDRAFT_94451 [Gelatoporia subvermispora B]|uniref:Uncharacterized protein n=1 Tax=Ceriporiopsis subvermispora (strain B) TaxID=914234 RepID=M2QZ70_CERS8|nr:hypothetical protein CERSUDRAFT_94451 [Gelatoporia subvermispora B]